MFTQKEIAVAFGITTQAVTTALHGCTPVLRAVVQAEGRRSVRRNVRTYHPSDVFALAVRRGNLQQYNELCEGVGISPAVFHVTRKEIAFGVTLRRFLPDDIEILPQHPVGMYRLDFYLPAYGLGVEYDERRHQHAKQQDRDGERQRAIEGLTNIRIVRVHEGMEERGLFLVAQAIAPSPLHVRRTCKENGRNQT